MIRCTSKGTAVILTLMLLGCVDTSPLDFKPPPKADAAVDGPAIDGAVISACRDCVKGDDAPCRSIYDSCSGIATCTPTFDCLLDTGCFTYAAIQDRIDCGLPCLEANGVLSGSDPTTQLLGQINTCIVESCSTVCFTR